MVVRGRHGDAVVCGGDCGRPGGGVSKLLHVVARRTAGGNFLFLLKLRLLYSKFYCYV